MAGGHSCNKEGCLDCFYRTAAREIERLLEADRLLQQSWMRPAGEVDQNHLEQEVWNYFGRASDETTEGYSQAYADQMRTALLKISAFPPGDFRPLADEVAIWKLATDALLPVGLSENGVAGTTVGKSDG